MNEHEELIKALRYCGFDDRKPCNGCVLYDKTHGVDCLEKLHCDAADAIERLMEEVDRKDKAIERMRDLMKHYKAAYRTAYKLYQEARNEQQP